MSPDQYYLTPKLKEFSRKAESFMELFPALAVYVIDRPNDFRGLTMFLGDTAEYVVGIRIYNGDGGPEVCWSSADDPLSALISLNKRVGDGQFKIDTPKPSS